MVHTLDGAAGVSFIRTDLPCRYLFHSSCGAAVVFRIVNILLFLFYIRLCVHVWNLTYNSTHSALGSLMPTLSLKLNLKMICNDFLVVKVNWWSYVFNIMKYM